MTTKSNKLSDFIWSLVFLVAMHFTVAAREVLAAPASFQQGITDYNKGNYRQALQTFQAYVSAYPSNAYAHYYLGLTQLALRNRAAARSEFQWVQRCGDPKLGPLAQKGLQQLGEIGSTYVAYSGPSSASGSAAVRGQPGGRVSKIIEFYADW